MDVSIAEIFQKQKSYWDGSQGMINVPRYVEMATETSKWIWWLIIERIGINMHIVLFRYSARVVKLKYLYNWNAVIIAPEVQRKKYEDYLAEGNNLPKVIFFRRFYSTKYHLRN